MRRIFFRVLFSSVLTLFGGWSTSAAAGSSSHIDAALMFYPDVYAEWADYGYYHRDIAIRDPAKPLTSFTLKEGENYSNAAGGSARRGIATFGFDIQAAVDYRSAPYRDGDGDGAKYVAGDMQAESSFHFSSIEMVKLISQDYEKNGQTRKWLVYGGFDFLPTLIGENAVWYITVNWQVKTLAGDLLGGFWRSFECIAFEDEDCSIPGRRKFWGNQSFDGIVGETYRLEIGVYASVVARANSGVALAGIDALNTMTTSLVSTDPAVGFWTESGEAYPLVPIPEPNSTVLLAIGLGCVVVLPRIRTRIHQRRVTSKPVRANSRTGTR